MGTHCNATHCTWRDGLGVRLSPVDVLAWRRDVRELRVSVRQTSGSRGQGAFAAQRAEPGRFVCSYVGTIHTLSELAAHYASRGEMPVYVYRLGEGKVIDASGSQHFSRLINHHQMPNLHAVVSTAEERIDFYAKRPLRVGMELTIDYGVNYWRGRTDQPAAGTDSRVASWGAARQARHTRWRRRRWSRDARRDRGHQCDKDDSWWRSPPSQCAYADADADADANADGADP